MEFETDSDDSSPRRIPKLVWVVTVPSRMEHGAGFFTHIISDSPNLQ